MTLNAMNFRIVEEVGDDKIITYFQVEQLNNKYFYIYNDVNHGPFITMDDAVQAAYEDLIPQDSESL